MDEFMWRELLLHLIIVIRDISKITGEGLECFENRLLS